MRGTNDVLGGGGIHHVAMRVQDFDASVRFYTDLLGLRNVLQWGEGPKRAVMLDTGDGSCIELFAGGTPEPKPEGHVIHFALRCRDVDGVYARALAAGAPSIIAPKDVEIASTPPLPVRLAFFGGPDGETIELFCDKTQA